eukprot:TRINITY_DN14645_c0_g1_i1.p1 TRINITY_DN14645_c0_g1~~TRINITY_DN14645_c0_g1_i1.p1  ORF type:complete len:274 (+),score=28.94 TRINITY_DN14645_c0_g1_i1:230-1051(+)
MHWCTNLQRNQRFMQIMYVQNTSKWQQFQLQGGLVMKKIKCIICIIIINLVINIFCGCSENLFKGDNSQRSNFMIGYRSKNCMNVMKVLDYDKVKDSLIRFHVIANSDTKEDQALKLKVRDKVIDYLYPYLSKSLSLDESRKIIKNNEDKVQKICEQVIADNNYNYNVKLQLSHENFPDKTYGNLELPQGNYEAFRIIIGKGKGKNWWCVMFPPLCFVDESKAVIEYEKTEEALNKLKPEKQKSGDKKMSNNCLLYTSPSPRDRQKSRMPSSA